MAVGPVTDGQRHRRDKSHSDRVPRQEASRARRYIDSTRTDGPGGRLVHDPPGLHPRASPGESRPGCRGARSPGFPRKVTGVVHLSVRRRRASCGRTDHTMVRLCHPDRPTLAHSRWARKVSLGERSVPWRASGPRHGQARKVPLSPTSDAVWAGTWPVPGPSVTQSNSDEDAAKIHTERGADYQKLPRFDRHSRTKPARPSSNWTPSKPV